MFIILGIIVVAYLLYRAKELGYFDKFSGNKDAVSTPTNAGFYPCVIEGSVDGSPMADRLNALTIEAASKGIPMTGDYVTDYMKQGGEMHITGHGFKFTIDATGQIVKDQSHANIFDVDYPCEGGMNPDGTLGMAVDCGGAKLGVKGRIVDGKFVGGEIRKGWLPHIYGTLTGTYTRT